MKKLVSAFLLIGLIVISPIAISAQMPITVFTNILCPLNETMQDAEAITKQKRVSPKTTCLIIPPMELPIIEIVSKAYKDTDGDTFYVVQVSKEPELYTLAWPGFNSTLKKDREI